MQVGNVNLGALMFVASTLLFMAGEIDTDRIGNDKRARSLSE
jgi:hypothetical protein